jgi:hypothetical protein
MVLKLVCFSRAKTWIKWKNVFVLLACVLWKKSNKNKNVVSFTLSLMLACVYIICLTLQSLFFFFFLLRLVTTTTKICCRLFNDVGTVRWATNSFLQLIEHTHAILFYVNSSRINTTITYCLCCFLFYSFLVQST